MNQTPIHISERFFSKAKRYFGSLDSALNEALQNAYRATLPRLRGGDVCRIETTWDPVSKSLRIRDFGIGIDDVGAALSIGVSNWGRGVEEEQDPAGMGLCGVMAFCDGLVIQSRFGYVAIDTKRFFEEAQYRTNLLASIQGAPSVIAGEGTAITMRGIHAADIHAVQGALLAAARFHTALAITFQVDGGPVEPIKNFLQLESWKQDPELYRGYKVFRSQNNRFQYHYTSDTMTVVWHGQRITVPLRDVKARVRLPELGEPVEIDMVVPGTQHCAVVIDYGSAPVTPKLPDRTSLVLDEKTTEFISGIFMPEIQNRIEMIRKVLSGAKQELATGTPEHRQEVIYDIVKRSGGCRHGYGSMERTCELLPGLVFNELYNHYLGYALVETLTPRDLGEGSEGRFRVDLVPFDKLPAVYAGKVLLWSDRSNCGRFFEGTNENVNRFVIQEVSDAEAGKTDWSNKATTAINGFEVIDGLAHSIEEATGSWDEKRYEGIQFSETLVVVHLDKTAKQLKWPLTEGYRAAVVEKTPGPVKLTLVTYVQGGEIATWVNGLDTRVLVNGEDPVVAITAAELIATGEHLEVPCAMFRFDDDMESSDSIFVGPEAAIMTLIDLAASYEHCSPGDSSDMSSEEYEAYVTDHWDDFRSKISGVPELSAEIGKIVNLVRNRTAAVQGSRVVSFSVDLIKQSISCRTTNGKTVKTTYR